MDTVRHRMVAERSGTLVSEDDRYRASFDAGGFRLGLRGEAGGGVRVSTTGLVQGSTPIKITAGPWRGQSNVAWRSLGAGIVERVTATGGQLEWDVVLGSPLVGTGDLRIDANVTGSGRHPERGRGGWRWDLGDDRRAVMGDLVVKDRTGAELYRAVPQAGRSGVRLTVPASVLQGAAYPLTVDPTVSPEYPVSDPVRSRAAGSQAQSAVAFDGTNYLVVWSDGRSGTGSDIYGARVSKAGTVLDGVGIPISTAANDQTVPAVAFDGTNYLVAWTDHRSGTRSDIYGARVSTAGTVLDSSGIPISTTANSHEFPAVAFDGINYLVAWTAWSSGTGFALYGARVSKAGTVLDGSGIPISTINTGAAGGQNTSAVAFDGTNYLVVWADDRSGTGFDIYGARVSKAGTVLDGSGIPISTAAGDQTSPAVAYDGTNYLVVWTDTYDIYGTRVSKAGTVLDSSGIPISSTAFGDYQTGPAVAFDGTNYLAVWTSASFGFVGTGVMGARVSQAGTVSSAIIIPNAADQYDPAVAFDGTNYLVVRTKPLSDPPNSDIYGVRVSTAGTVLDSSGTLISTASNAQNSPAVAFDGTNYLVVWTDFRSGTGTEADIYGARVSKAGTVLDGTGIRISTAAKLQSAPAVAFDGTNYLVVWQDNRAGTSNDIYGARVSTAGTVQEASGIPISTTAGNQSEPSVAFDGTNYLVAWTVTSLSSGCGFICISIDIYGARVSKAGTVLDGSGIPISTAANDQTAPALAFDGTNYLVVWSDKRSGTGYDIYGARVSTAGTVLDGSGIPISTTANDQSFPVVAFDGTNYLVAWTDDRSGTGYDIYGARVSKAGTVQEASGIPVSTAPGSQDEPTVIANGSFLVVWRDQRSGTSSDIYGTRVNGAGGVLDGAGIAIATNTTGESAPAVAAGPGAKFGVVYQRFAPKAHGSQRVFLRTVAPK